jgi:hypothetical protein
MLTPVEEDLVRQWRIERLSWRVITRILMKGEHAIRKEIEPGYMLAERYKYFVRRGTGMPTHAYERKPCSYKVDKDSFTVPQYLWNDRERRVMLEHHSLTAQLMGDPLPGYSALDRRRGCGGRNG